ncbi:MAG: single-stranded-DNA-specific exonuclease RecJ, partial [Firmicutes bacterium]|nr:single-stranded-DNA-specific exonuclease RecJ [Bacillota bacterium]
MSLSRKRWHEPAPVSAEKSAALAEALDILPATARVLLNRGIADAASGREFLRPSLEQLHSPWLMTGMEQAVARIGTALEKGEKIVVYGDYDV